MYLVHLKGGAGQFEVSDGKGNELKNLLADKTKHSAYLDIQGHMFQVHAIKAIVPMRPSQSDKEPEPKPVPMTPEQRVAWDEWKKGFLDDMREEFSKKGILGGKSQKKYTADLEWHPNCIVCGKENPAGMARVCSSKCYLEAPLNKAPAV